MVGGQGWATLVGMPGLMLGTVVVTMLVGVARPVMLGPPAAA
jgi:hypothetical protein